jgi:hypothetical protein
MNPFKVLNINRHVLNKEIIQAAALGMREKKYSAREIAQAQKMLLDPVTRACQEFLYFVDLTDAKERLVQRINENQEALEGPEDLEISDGSQLRCLTLFEKNHDH